MYRVTHPCWFPLATSWVYLLRGLKDPEINSEPFADKNYKVRSSAHRISSQWLTDQHPLVAGTRVQESSFWTTLKFKQMAHVGSLLELVERKINRKLVM